MKILVVLPRFPYPLDKGDKLRAYNQIKYLSQNHEIYLLCGSHDKVSPDQVEHLKPFCKEIKVVKQPRLINYFNIFRNYMRIKSLQIGYWDSGRIRKAFRKMDARIAPEVIYSQMVRTMPWVARSKRPKVMDFQDALSMNTERRMDHANGFWRYILHFEFKMLRSSEYNAFKIFDALTIISEVDADAIPHKKSSEIRIVPNGVDFDYFHPMEHNKDYQLVFCGNMNYAPNVNASLFLVEKVMPLVWKQMPEVRLLLAGANPKKSLLKIDDSRITVSGRVPDIRDSYASAKVFVAPMQIGSGLQNKLLEAMAMELPCVTTTIANDSLKATPDTHILVADKPADIANAIVRLLNDDVFAARIAKAGNDFVHQHYGWASAVKPLEDILALAASDQSPRLN